MIPESIKVGGALITTIDLVGLGFFVCCWLLHSLLLEYRLRSDKPSVIGAMSHHRLRWMRNVLKRDNRMQDVSAVGNMMRSISFFASTTVLIIVGLISILSKPETLNHLIETVPFAEAITPLMWEFKVLILTMVFIYAFFKYTWSLRQYNYVNILVSSAPLHYEQKEHHDDFARQAAKLLTNAARHFSDGLKAYYFAMAGLAWFIHAYIFVAATILVTFVMLRREFKSRTLKALTIPGLSG
jgi:uncharacterized membrane protein